MVTLSGWRAPPDPGGVPGAVASPRPWPRRCPTGWSGPPSGAPTRPVSTWPGCGGRRTPTTRPSAGCGPTWWWPTRRRTAGSTSSGCGPAGIPVWVTVTESVDQALGSLRRLLVDVLGAELPVWWAEAAAEWARPPDLPAARVVVPIWRDPWMVVGARTFSGDLLARLGLTHVLAGGADRYPKVTLSELVGPVARTGPAARRALPVRPRRRTRGVRRHPDRPGVGPGPHLVRTVHGHRPGPRCRPGSPRPSRSG